MKEILTVTVLVNANGRIVIPASFRKVLGIAAGDRLTLSLVDGEAKLATRKQKLKESQKLIRQYVGTGRKLSDELVAERRKAALDE